jgi:hypothetical protein
MFFLFVKVIARGIEGTNRTEISARDMVLLHNNDAYLVSMLSKIFILD